jgi:hypothetical protein
VQRDQLTVCRRAQIELERVAPHPQREIERGERVLRLVSGCSAVGEHGDAGWARHAPEGKQEVAKTRGG